MNLEETHRNKITGNRLTPQAVWRELVNKYGPGRGMSKTALAKELKILPAQISQWCSESHSRTCNHEVAMRVQDYTGGEYLWFWLVSGRPALATACPHCLRDTTR